MPKIKPITELRNTTEISEICHSDLEPVFITKNGYADMVVMSMETYDQLLEMNKVDNAIIESENDGNDVLIDARDAVDSLRRKHFG
ncbi:type II toxin-antitoxin system Phd/YefM family antitoxin [Acidaminobacter sp. JC074]|uniref:type II toxin-antitoxin system Phd/YefM family antitoxin n=1 Tax=Acidaminobacter sp. JC074 TaxID=2530199 RepID=UPI001F0DE1F8|nr:type II toxin-antitoxin system Phd/YefM family antitoxin [Acidaminobacter sp. JC074]MCH4891266.1 type II toxin-antitoxin system Phd/YefM family antitoxin [Acidaminobacter sp. JC074]